MKKILFFAIVGAFFFSCSNSVKSPSTDVDSTAQTDQNQLVIQNNMEDAASMIPSWINEVTVVKMDKIKAHSGEYASMVDQINIYSYTYRENFENINQKLPIRVVVNGWFYTTEDNEKLSYAMDINEKNVSYIWKSYKLKNENPAINQWNEFTAYFTVDKPLKPNFQIKLYGFGGNKVAYFDDIKIIFEY